MMRSVPVTSTPRARRCGMSGPTCMALIVTRLLAAPCAGALGVGHLRSARRPEVCQANASHCEHTSRNIMCFVLRLSRQRRGRVPRTAALLQPREWPPWASSRAARSDADLRFTPDGAWAPCTAASHTGRGSYQVAVQTKVN